MIHVRCWCIVIKDILINSTANEWIIYYILYHRSVFIRLQEVWFIDIVVNDI